MSDDLTALIQEVVDRPGWAAGNSLSIIQSHDSGGQRHAHTYNGNAASAPMLRIKVNGALVTGGSGFKTVRTRLKEIIDDFDHLGHTPIVDTMYEAARYYRGDSVFGVGPSGVFRLIPGHTHPHAHESPAVRTCVPPRVGLPVLRSIAR